MPIWHVHKELRGWLAVVRGFRGTAHLEGLCPHLSQLVGDTYHRPLGSQQPTKDADGRYLLPVLQTHPLQLPGWPVTAYHTPRVPPLPGAYGSGRAPSCTSGLLTDSLA